MTYILHCVKNITLYLTDPTSETCHGADQFSNLRFLQEYDIAPNVNLHNFCKIDDQNTK